MGVISKIIGMAAVSAVAYDYNTKEQVIIRNYRTMMCGLRLLYNYKIRFGPDNVNEIHENTAKDIYEICKKNDGLYVKFG